jgi:hypothetical protein
MTVTEKRWREGRGAEGRAEESGAGIDELEG